MDINSGPYWSLLRVALLRCSGLLAKNISGLLKYCHNSPFCVIPEGTPVWPTWIEFSRFRMAPIGPLLGQISGLILGVFCDLKIGALGKVTLSSRLLAEKLSAIMKHWLDSPFWAASGGAPVWPQMGCLLYTSPSPRDQRGSRMPASA